MQLASGLHWLWHIRGYWNEAAEWLEKLLSTETDRHSSGTKTDSQILLRVKALWVLSDKVGNLGDFQRLTTCVEESLMLCEELSESVRVPLIAGNTYLLGGIASLSGDVDKARILGEQSIGLFQRSGDKFGIAEVQSNLLIPLANRSEEWETARTLNESHLAIRRELGDKEGTAFGLYHGGITAVSQGDYDPAQNLFETAIEASHAARSNVVLGTSIGGLVVVHLLKRDMHQMHEHILQLVMLAQEKWDPTLKAVSVCLLALYGFEHKQFRKFTQLYGFLQSENPIRIFLYHFKFLETVLHKYMAIAHAEVGEEIFKQAEAEGKTMTLDQAFEYALERFDE